MPKYAVEVTGVVTRSAYIIVEAATPTEACENLERLFNAGGLESDTILNILSDHPDDVETTFRDVIEVEDSRSLTNLS